MQIWKVPIDEDKLGPATDTDCYIDKDELDDVNVDFGDVEFDGNGKGVGDVKGVLQPW